MTELNHSVSPTRTYAIVDTTGVVHQFTLPKEVRANDNRTAAAYFDKYLPQGVHAEVCVSIEQAQHMGEFSFDIDSVDEEAVEEAVEEEEFEERYLRADGMFDEDEEYEEEDEEDEEE